MKDFKYILPLLLIFLPGYVFGQQKVDTKGYSASQLRNFAKNADRLGDIYTAIDFLEPYCKMKPHDGEMNYRLGSLYFMSHNYEKAEQQFKKVYKDDADKYAEALYYEAECLKSLGRYAEAKELLTRFQRKLKHIKNTTLTFAFLRGEIAGCDSAQGIIDHPLKVKIEAMNTTVNGPHIELSPIPVSDSVFYYSSLRMDSVFYFERDDTLHKPPVRQFYEARLEGNDWIGGEALPPQINIPGVETGNGALSRDGNRFYFTRCAPNWMGKMRCEIYMTQRAKNGWAEPVKLNSLINDPNYTATQPAIGYTSHSNFEVIYFVSDRPGGRGGMDIWYTIYNPRKKDFMAPRNAGIKINTAGDEMTPFYDHTTRTLYFSSTGHIGLGGFDIFSSMGELRRWHDVENLGYPLNSSYDDLYFTISKGREYGYFVSNRPDNIPSFRNPSCCDDIFQYRWTDFIKLAVTGKIFPAEEGKIGKNVDQEQLMSLADSIPPMENAVVSLYMIDKKTKEKIFINRDTTGKDGTYYFDLLPDRDYKFEMEGAQYFNEQVNLSTDGINFSYTVEMPPIWVNIISDKPIVLNNIYYEFDKSELTQQAKNVIDTTLLELMNKATDIIVEVSAHTDSVGNFEYNKKLSQERADNVVNYLISKGISKKRLVAKGYGSEKPIAPNFNPDGSDNPAGREKNRRTEFRVIGTLSSLEEVDTEE